MGLRVVRSAGICANHTYFYLVYIMMTLHMAGPLLTVGALALSLIFPMVCTPRDKGTGFLSQ